MTATNTFFFSNTILWAFTSLFHKVQISPDFFYPGKKTLTGLQRKYSTQEDAKYDLKVSFLTLFRKPCQYGNILAESICMLLTKKGFFCSRSSERILILVFLWCKATNFRGINVDCRLATPISNQIAGFGGFRPPASLEKNKIITEHKITMKDTSLSHLTSYNHLY